MARSLILTLALVLSVAAPAHAADSSNMFTQAINSVKSWFGSNDDMMAANDDLQAQTQSDVQDIEPAAGIDTDTIQVPPPYMDKQSSNDSTGIPSAFDNVPSMAAFNDASDVADIAPAAGEASTLDVTNIDCEAVMKAVDAAKTSGNEGDIPDTAIIESCEEVSDTEGMIPAADLPVTQPAAGEPPVGEAIMPGTSK